MLIWSSFALLISGPVGRFLFRLSIFVEIVDTAFFNFFLRRHSRQRSHDSIMSVFFSVKVEALGVVLVVTLPGEDLTIESRMS